MWCQLWSSSVNWTLCLIDLYGSCVHAWTLPIRYKYSILKVTWLYQQALTCVFESAKAAYAGWLEPNLWDLPISLNSASLFIWCSGAGWISMPEIPFCSVSCTFMWGNATLKSEMPTFNLEFLIVCFFSALWILFTWAALKEQTMIAHPALSGLSDVCSSETNRSVVITHLFSLIFWFIFLHLIAKSWRDHAF